MKPATRFLFVTILLLAAGLGFYALREHRRFATQQRTLAEKIAAARAAVDRAQRERDTTERELAAQARATRQANEAAAAAAAVRAANPSSHAVAEWERQVATLRGLLQRHPSWAIPEIDLLTPEEFIFFAREAKLDGEEAERKALSGLRALAKRKLAQQFIDALGDYARANKGRLPSDFSELTPHFKTPVPEVVLKRYALTGLAAVGSGRSDDWVLYERAPVDELYDTRHVLSTRMSHQYPTDPGIYVLSRAIAAYADANAGRKPANVAELGPFMEVPLEAATLAHYFSTWQQEPFTFGLTQLSSAMVFRDMGQPKPAAK